MGQRQRNDCDECGVRNAEFGMKDKYEKPSLLDWSVNRLTGMG